MVHRAFDLKVERLDLRYALKVQHLKCRIARTCGETVFSPFDLIVIVLACVNIIRVKTFFSFPKTMLQSGVPNRGHPA